MKKKRWLILILASIIAVSLVGCHKPNVDSSVENSSSALPPVRPLEPEEKPNPDYDIADWVLSRLPKDEEPRFFSVLESIPDILSLMLVGETEKAMCDFNGISK